MLYIILDIFLFLVYHLKNSRSGETGKHAWFRTMWAYRPWGFNSPLRHQKYYLFIIETSNKTYLGLVRYLSMARAAFLPAPIAEITVAAPVTISPPANTPSLVVLPPSSLTIILPHLLVLRL